MKRSVKLFAIGTIAAGFLLGGASIAIAEGLQNNLYDSIRLEVEGSADYEAAYNEALNNLQYNVAQNNISAEEYLAERKNIETDAYMADVYFAEESFDGVVKQELAERQDKIETLRGAGCIAMVGGLAAVSATAMAIGAAKSTRECIRMEREDRSRIREQEREIKERLTRYAREIAEREAEKEV